MVKKLLVLSGGGSYGAFEMGVVSRLIMTGKGGWDVITGVSAGSINACYLSTIDKDEEIDSVYEFKTLWTNIKDNNIYKSDYFFNGLSLYETKPLEDELASVFKDKVSVRPVIISATSLSNSEARHFTNADITKYGFKDLIMCSTAIPLLFPPYPFLDDMFCDGGLTSNIILYEGINYCIENFPDEDIEVDVVICGKQIGKQVVNKDNINFKLLLQKLAGIITQQVEYSQIMDLYTNENSLFIYGLNNINTSKNIKITVYEQKTECSISLLDFESCDVLWNQGFEMTNVEVREINPC